MKLTTLDWTIVGLVIATVLTVGIWVSKRASRDSASFFLASRHMPWWLLGTSMVATTFAADTPNLVTGLVRTGGVAANWSWWCFLISGMLTAFIYARLWRRLGVTTDIEFYELRYSGKPAAFLRGFRALYLGFFFNIIIMGNVTLAATKFGNVLFDVSPEAIVLVAGLVTVIFSAAGGLMGVLVTDLFLFVIAMTGSIVAAYYALDHSAVGGLTALTAHPLVVEKLAFLPDLSDPDQFIPLLLIPLAVQWWSAWYPGSEPGGGGYVAQRMLAAKDERHAVGATVFFNLAHYALRPWPWILVALASLIVFPDLASLQKALPHIDPSILKDDLAYPAMLTFLPSGLLGLVVASLIAAYVSTISTSLNWGASYFVNDVYSRFIRTDVSEKRKVFIGRVVTVLLMICAGILALKLESAMQSFRIMVSVGAGTGLLFFLRWFWTRINAWSEIAAMIFSFCFSVGLEFWGPADWENWERYCWSVLLTTMGWVSVTLLTPKTDATKLCEFHTSLNWQPDQEVSQQLPSYKNEIKSGLFAALSATVLVYALLFGTGYFLYGKMSGTVICFIIAMICLFFVRKNIMHAKHDVLTLT